MFLSNTILSHMQHINKYTEHMFVLWKWSLELVVENIFGPSIYRVSISITFNLWFITWNNIYHDLNIDLRYCVQIIDITLVQQGCKVTHCRPREIKRTLESNNDTLDTHTHKMSFPTTLCCYFKLHCICRGY